LEWHRFRLSCLPAPVGLLILDRGSIPNRLEEAVVIEPPDPVERGKLHVFEASPGPAAVNHLRLEKTDDGFSQRIVVAVALASHRGLDACLGQPLGVANLKVLGRFNWSSQHLITGGCDEYSKAGLGPGGTWRVRVPGPPLGRTSRGSDTF